MNEHSQASASTGTSPDWAALRAEAVAVSRHAYVPYSLFPVGAAAVTTHGRIVRGCNVENAAYGVALCAECGLVSALLAGASTSEPISSPEAERERLVALSCVDDTGRPITPCGRCRQLLGEHAAPGMLVERADGPPFTLDELLPHAFGVADLDAVPTSAETLRGES